MMRYLLWIRQGGELVKYNEYSDLCSGIEQMCRDCIKLGRCNTSPEDILVEVICE